MLLLPHPVDHGPRREAPCALLLSAQHVLALPLLHHVYKVEVVLRLQLVNHDLVQKVLPLLFISSGLVYKPSHVDLVVMLKKISFDLHTHLPILRELKHPEAVDSLLHAKVERLLLALLTLIEAFEVRYRVDLFKKSPRLFDVHDQRVEQSHLLPEVS